MDVARHVFDTYFKDTTNPLVRHHLDSYRDLLRTKIPTFLAGMNPHELNLGDGRFIRIFLGGRKGDEITYHPPVDETGNAILPHQCRLDNKTYALTIRMNVEIEYEIKQERIVRRFEDIALAQLPLMLKSSLCYLTSMTSDQLYDVGECRFELGGYFVIGGAEKALLTQERLADNMFYAGKRKEVPDSAGARTLVEKESASKIEDSTKASPDEYFSAIRSISEDGTKGPYSHFLKIPPPNRKPDDPKEIAKTSDYADFSTKRLCVITLPDFTQPVPLVSVFRALGLTNDQDMYDTILAGIPPLERTQYDELFAEMILSHDTFTRQQMASEEDQNQNPDLLFLKRQTRTRSEGGVYLNLYNKMFPHCEYLGESPSAFYRRKAYLLGTMTRMAMDAALGIRAKSDRDHLRYKRLAASGELLFQEFRRIFKETAKRMLTEIDSKIHFEQQQFAGTKVAEVVQDENIGYYWRSYNFLNEIEKSFKGTWGGKDGVAQELSRFSFLGTVAQLRRINVDVDKGSKLVEMRRIHGSSWGLLCPIDNPDGRNIGLIKSMTLLCSISTASPSERVRERIARHSAFVPLAAIHPSIWDPRWTRVYVNSDLVGILTSNADALHTDLLDARRSDALDPFVSVCWNRLDNEYLIYTDAGRPARPIYREGVTPAHIKRAHTWDAILRHMDYIDPSEVEGIRISMEPFHPSMHSEIHGLAILSASTSVLPNCDFDPGTRNAFSCQQVKQACGWYNTAFSKRFDTIATWLNYAQRPLSQTWVYNHVLGKGCLPYGENPMVALMVYSGYNQEDSILLNEGSLRRGMFHTTYYHSYKIEEDALEMGFKDDKKPFALRATEFGNIATDPKFRETVTRKEGYDYSKLDADGIARVGEEINETTILVGKVHPITDASGQITGYRDVSVVPKRGQVGFVDSVYRYVNRDGLRAVKIRVAEHRIPVLGDKFSARHGQKGTCGLRIAEEDMPFTAQGLRPDMIVNPHAFPSRMTIGQFIESMSTKLGVEIGCLVDSTPFSAQNRVAETSELLMRAGFHPYGHEVLYNGQTGEMMEAEIFMAPTYYIRSKLMVEDKINYRATGPVKLLTHQPVEGRANDGGLRIGEMERDVLIAHGISKFLNESLMERSDKTEILYQPETGLLDANPDYITTKLETPYALSLVVHELESMHISVNLVSGSS